VHDTSTSRGLAMSALIDQANATRAADDPETLARNNADADADVPRDGTESE
jgi:ribosome-binding factor A